MAATLAYLEEGREDAWRSRAAQDSAEAVPGGPPGFPNGGRPRGVACGLPGDPNVVRRFEERRRSTRGDEGARMIERRRSRSPPPVVVSPHASPRAPPRPAGRSASPPRVPLTADGFADDCFVCATRVRLDSGPRRRGPDVAPPSPRRRSSPRCRRRGVASTRARPNRDVAATSPRLAAATRATSPRIPRRDVAATCEPRAPRRRCPAVAASWIFRGDAARPRRGYSAGTSRGAAAAASWTFPGGVTFDGSVAAGPSETRRCAAT